MLFVDFHKAFDTIDHTVLQQKLQAVAISGNLYDLLVDYLSNRHRPIRAYYRSNFEDAYCRVWSPTRVPPRHKVI